MTQGGSDAGARRADGHVQTTLITIEPNDREVTR
jgi:hypothetical protein